MHAQLCSLSTAASQPCAALGSRQCTDNKATEDAAPPQEHYTYTIASPIAGQGLPRAQGAQGLGFRRRTLLVPSDLAAQAHSSKALRRVM